MLTMYLCFLAGGTVIPLINFIFGFLSDGLHSDMHGDLNTHSDLDTHFSFHHDLSAGTGSDSDVDTHMDMNMGSLFSVGLIPTSLLSISTFAIIFGASGALMTIGSWSKLLTLGLAIIFGYLAAVLIQTIINTLKMIQTRSSGIDENELILYDGKIIDTILPGQFGTVSFVTLKNVLVSYPAKCEDSNQKIEKGSIVEVKEIKNGVFIVEPKNKYE